MSDTPEPLAAILAEMREALPEFELTNKDVERLFRFYADRIEAAYKREHAEWHAETEAAKDARDRVANRMRSEFAAKCRDCTERVPGNAAAMREALEHVEKLAREFAVGNYYVCDFPKMLLNAIQAALAAPARNFDRFTDGDTASNTYEDEGGEKDYLEFARWLFATAEGGDHA